MSAHHLIPIPAGAKQTPCTSCGQAIYFGPHPLTDRPHPISTSHALACEPTGTAPGKGISHFSDCPSADQHRRKPAPTEERPHRALRGQVATTPLEAAELVPLIGDSTKWDGYGSKPLGVVPDKVLKLARRWMSNRMKESNTPDERLARQVAAITVVLNAREANSPQQSLAL